MAKVDSQNCRKRLARLRVKSQRNKNGSTKRRDLAKSQHFPVYTEEPYFHPMPVHKPVYYQRLIYDSTQRNFSQSHSQSQSFSQPQSHNFNQSQSQFQPPPDQSQPHQSQNHPQNQAQNLFMVLKLLPYLSLRNK